MTQRRSGQARASAVVAALLVAAGFAALSASAIAHRLETKLSAQSLPADLETRNRLRSVLRRGGNLDLRPPAGLLVEQPPGADGRCPDLEIGPCSLAPAEVPSTSLAPAAATDGRPLLSL